MRWVTRALINTIVQGRIWKNETLSAILYFIFLFLFLFIFLFVGRGRGGGNGCEGDSVDESTQAMWLRSYYKINSMYNFVKSMQVYENVTLNVITNNVFSFNNPW